MSFRRRLARSTSPVVLAMLLALPWTAAVADIEPAAPKPEGRPQAAAAADLSESDPPAAAAKEAELITGVRQLIFEGRRSGEGYFSRDGRHMVFQSEREPGNPYFQIYLLDLESGDAHRVSPGHGKTTCAWIHPGGQKVLFASTHDDPQARQKQADEIKRREEGKERRYSWDYDEHYDLYECDLSSRQCRNLTKTPGYDAEGSWSPDGARIAFASNRRAYAKEAGEEELKRFRIDPSYLMEIYLMDADGSNVRRLTDSPGYDGGPFFSPDGKRICWRRFSEDGATAEIMTMNLDGSDQRRLTRLGAMSWAPFYHPSGEYLIFTTNRHGFGNFELYLVDVGGRSPPVRATYTKGFDGLPVFSPDGKRLAWTTGRTAGGQSQIFLAAWNHSRARQLLGLDAARPPLTGEKPATAATETGEPQTADARRAAAESARLTAPDYSSDDLRRHVEYLCRPELAGRLTGTPGERQATEYVAAYFEKLGLKPAGEGGSWFQPFDFTAGVTLGKENRLTWGPRQYELNRQWRPVAFSQTGTFGPAPVAFAGYGIVAPAAEGQAAYDSFVHLDVAGKWVLAFRYVPEGVSPERRQHLAQYASLRHKAMTVRDRGARGLVLLSGPNSQAKNPLAPLQLDGSMAGASVSVVSVTDEVAGQWLAATGKNVKGLQDQLDRGEPVMGFALKGVELAAAIDIGQVKRTGRNVLGRLQAGPQPGPQAVVVGAHVDHLGKGPSGNSLARDEQPDAIHYGADDNASGVAAMLEIAQHLADRKAAGQLPMQRDVLFAAWSGEELGTLGSSHFVRKLAEATTPAGPRPTTNATVHPAIAACLNLDMVGRLDKKLTLQGVGSSGIWRREIEQRNAPVGLPIALEESAYLPTDAGPFYLRGVPILSAFTGPHRDYHTPGDTPDKLNYQGAAETARLMGLLCRSLAARPSPPDYVALAAPKQGPRRAGLRAYLGTIPEYAGDVKGLKLSGVAKDGPAAKAGLRAGDVIVELAGRKVENVYDYTYAIEALKVGQKTSVSVVRDGKRVTLEITPGTRE